MTARLRFEVDVDSLRWADFWEQMRSFLERELGVEVRGTFMSFAGALAPHSYSVEIVAGGWRVLRSGDNPYYILNRAIDGVIDLELQRQLTGRAMANLLAAPAMLAAGAGEIVL